MMPFLAGEILTAAALNGALPLAKVKSADETVNNSATRQNDDHLAIVVEVNTLYILEMDFVFNSGATPDFQFGFSFPAGTGGRVIGMAHDTAGAVFTFTADLAVSNPSLNGIGADAHVHVSGQVLTAGTAGTLQFRWAQFTANASNTIVRQGSSMRLIKAT
jgi:hypothetical protein